MPSRTRLGHALAAVAALGVLIATAGAPAPADAAPQEAGPSDAIPTGLAPGNQPIQISVNGVLSNIATVAIAQ